MKNLYKAWEILPTTLDSGAQQTSPPKTQIIHAGKLLDVRTGRIQTDAYITVIGERIDSISESAPAAALSVWRKSPSPPPPWQR